MSNNIDRRSLVKGSIWSVPIIAAAIAAPSAAASRTDIPCPAIPLPASWITNVGAPHSSAGTSWKTTSDGQTWEVITDANSLDFGQATTTYTRIPMTAGTTYNFKFVIQTKKGHDVRCKTVNSQAKITVNAGPGSTAVLFEGYTQTGAGVQVAPPRCETGTPGSVWGNNSVEGDKYIAYASFTPKYTANVDLSFRIQTDPTTGGDNDDWRITPSFVTCQA
ncbi:MAG: hypothetical protein ACTIA6_02645 [Pseudoclavibacter sp.]